MANNPETYLDKFLQKDIQDSSNNILPTRPVLRVLGSASVVDNPENNSTDLTATAAADGQVGTAVANGLNSNIVVDGSVLVRLTGPTGAFAVGGFALSSGGWAGGQRVVFQNTTTEAMTIVNEDLSSTATNRIITGSGQSVTLPPRKGVVSCVYDSVTARLVVQNIGLQYPSTIDIRELGADPTGTVDATAFVRAAHDIFTSAGGEIFLADGCTFKVTNLVFTKPIHLRAKRTMVVQASGATGNLIETTANLKITGHTQNETGFLVAAGCTGLFLAAPWVNGGIGQYYGPALVLSDIFFSGGARSIDTAGLTGFYEGNLHLERVLFHDTTGLALNIDDSVYYGFLSRCHFYHCFQGCSVGTATETKFSQNVWVQAQGGGSSLILHGVAHVDFDHDEFYGWYQVTAPDITLYAENDSADGISGIETCKFGAELELSFTTARNRIQIVAPGGTAVATLAPKIRANQFYAPGAMSVTAYSWTGGSATATVLPNNGTDHGVQVGDQFYILGDPVVAHSDYQGGPWTCTARTATSVTWAHSGTLSNYAGVSALIFPGSVSAIAILTPVSRILYSANYFQGYPIGVDDSAIITEGTRDTGGRGVFDDTNRMTGPLGMAFREFKMGGRGMAVVQVGACSAGLYFDGQARRNETPEVRNRITVDSEDFTKWGNVGSIGITAGQTDPWGTSRATILQRAGGTQITNGVWPAQGLGEALTVALNTANIKGNGFLSFWAKQGGTVPSTTLNVSIFNDGNGNVMLDEQVALGANWKRHTLPFVYDASLGAVSLNISPGGFDACKATVVVTGFQVDDYAGDYVPVHYVLSTDTSFVDARLGNRYERDVGFAGLLRLEPNGDAAPTIAQVGTGLGTGAGFITTATDAGMLISVTTGTSPSSAGLITVAFGRTMPSAPLVLIQLEDGAGGYWPNGSVVKILSKTASGFTIDWNSGSSLPNASTADAVRFNILMLPIGAN
jgi:hypothetical protein